MTVVGGMSSVVGRLMPDSAGIDHGSLTLATISFVA
jgi:hypothetical protein